MKSNKNILDVMFKFFIKKIKFVLIIALLPQVLLLMYETTSVSEKCVGASKIRISKSVSNLKIVDEIFTENLEIEFMDGVFLTGPNLMIKGSTKEECLLKFTILKEKTQRANDYIEQFYLSSLTDQERSRFSGPILFNTIGGKKIQFARLTPIDFDILKKKDQSLRKIYTFIISIMLILSWGLITNYDKRKKYF